jgi:prolyl oligopeptidase
MRVILCFALMLFATVGAFALDTNDPYAWLEDVHGAKPLEWVAAQNKIALAKLKADPRYDADYKSVLAVLDAPDRIAYAGLDHGFAYNFWQDARNPKGVWRRTSIADYQTKTPHWDVLLDLDALARTEKENWVWKGAEVSPGEGRALVMLSRGGGDAVVVREFDLKSRAWVAGGFSMAEAKTDITWLDDDTVLFATAKDGATSSGYGRIVRQWTRGTPIARAATLYEGRTDDVGTSPVVFHTRQGTVALAMRSVSFFQTEYFRLENGQARKLPLPLSADVKGAQAGRLIFTLRAAWRAPDGHVLPAGALAAMALDGGAVRQLYAPGPRAGIESVAVGRDAVFAAVTENVVGHVEQFRWGDVDGDAWTSQRLALPEGGSADIAATDDYGPDALFSQQGYLDPPALFAYDDDRDAPPRRIKALPPRFDASAMVTEQFEATSKDGTKVPYFVTRPRVLHGPAPTILYGYGGFEVSLTPSYSANAGRLWVGKGGIYVVANIRGGGEFGPAWHEAAEKLHRQRAFDDFAAVADDLIKRKLTTPKQLGIMGGSNGGLLVSTVMTQIPEKLGAVVCQVPLIDMLAYTHIGAGASWIGEYGDPANPKERAAILAYSPYQNVKPDVKYPPVFFVTATSDDRVTPVHARKMAAKMEAQGHDVLFYENTDGGHAAAADHAQAAEMWALSYVYLAQKLGLQG